MSGTRPKTPTTDLTFSDEDLVDVFSTPKSIEGGLKQPEKKLDRNYVKIKSRNVQSIDEEYEFEADIKVSKHYEKKGFLLVKPRITIKSKNKKLKPKPHHINFVLDKSGSMSLPSEEPYKIQVLPPPPMADIKQIDPKKGILYVQQTGLEEDKPLQIAYCWLNEKREEIATAADREKRTDGLYIEHWTKTIVRSGDPVQKQIEHPHTKKKGAFHIVNKTNLYPSSLEINIKEGDLMEGTCEGSKIRESRRKINASVFATGLYDTHPLPKGVQHILLEAAQRVGLEETFLADPFTALKENIIQWGNKVNSDFFTCSLTSFSDEATIELKDGTPRELGAKINLISTGGDGTNISSGLLSRSGGAGATQLLITDGQANKGLLTAEAMLRARSETKDTTNKIDAVGIGTKYDPHELYVLAEQTGGSFIHLKTTTDIQTFFNKQLTPLLGNRASATIQIAFNQIPQVDHQIKGGIILRDKVTSETAIEVSMDDILENKPIPYHMRCIVGGKTIEVQGIWDPKKYLQSNFSVIKQYVAQQASEVCNSTLSNEAKVVKLYRLQKILDTHSKPHQAKKLKKLLKHSIFALQDGIAHTVLTEKQVALINKVAATLHQFSATQELRFKFTAIEDSNYDPDKHTLKIKYAGKEDEYRIIDRTINFADKKLDKKLVSIDPGITNREKIILDNDFFETILPTYINELTEEKKFPMERTLEEQLSAVASYVNETLLPNSDLNPVLGVGWQEKDITKAYSLKEFSSIHTGRCRHHVLANASIIGELFKQKKLDKNQDISVHVYRRIAWSLKSHTWVICKTKDALYLVDSTFKDKKVYNLKDPKQATAVLEAYEARDLHGILLEVFQENNIPHPKLTDISENAFNVLAKRTGETKAEKEQRNIRNAQLFRNYMCPILSKTMLDPADQIMRKPAYLRLKDGRVICCDYDAITAWFKAQKDNKVPYTVPFSKETMVLQAEEIQDRTHSVTSGPELPGIYRDTNKAQKIWELLHCSTQRLPEESVDKSMDTVDVEARLSTIEKGIKEDIQKNQKNGQPSIFCRPDLMALSPIYSPPLETLRDTQPDDSEEESEEEEEEEENEEEEEEEKEETIPLKSGFSPPIIFEDEKKAHTSKQLSSKTIIQKLANYDNTWWLPTFNKNYDADIKSAILPTNSHLKDREIGTILSHAFEKTIFFCKNRTRKKLENIKVDLSPASEQGWVLEFIKKYKKTNCLYRFFFSNLANFNPLTIILHAHDKTFWGNPNETFKILKRLGKINEDGEFVPKKLVK